MNICILEWMFCLLQSSKFLAYILGAVFPTDFQEGEQLCCLTCHTSPKKIILFLDGTVMWEMWRKYCYPTFAVDINSITVAFQLCVYVVDSAWTDCSLFFMSKITESLKIFGVSPSDSAVLAVTINDFDGLKIQNAAHHLDAEMKPLELLKRYTDEDGMKKVLFKIILSVMLLILGRPTVPLFVTQDEIIEPVTHGHPVSIWFHVSFATSCNLIIPLGCMWKVFWGLYIFSICWGLIVKQVTHWFTKSSVQIVYTALSHFMDIYYNLKLILFNIRDTAIVTPYSGFEV